jgi:hypothetical protein
MLSSSTGCELYQAPLRKKKALALTIPPSLADRGLGDDDAIRLARVLQNNSAVTCLE